MEILGTRSGRSARPGDAGFTMVEIALSLAIIGFALLAIIGALSFAMPLQRANREQTIINQDATVFIEAIRNGARGLDDLTNYVYAITNYRTSFPDLGRTVNGYTYTASSTTPSLPINSGQRIIGLLSTPEYTDNNGAPLPNLFNGGYSNHVVAYVRSVSGPAVEKPPQANGSIVREDSFGYRFVCVNAPLAQSLPPLWTSRAYDEGDTVAYILNGQATYWQAVVAGQPRQPPQSDDTPGSSVRWARVLYPQEMNLNTHELRLAFLWPQQPNGSLGPGHQTFRTLVAGQLDMTVTNNQALYFYQPQNFTSAP